MKLSTFFQNIAVNELKATSLIEPGSFTIEPTYLPTVIQSLNQALDYLFTTFRLKENQLILELRQGQSYYYIDEIYCKSNINSSHDKYICDTIEKPYTDDLVQILSVSQLDGKVLSLNDEFSPTGVHTPEYNCIHVPAINNNKHLVIVYQARHPVVKLTEPLDSNFVINIAPAYEVILQTYVACLLLQSMGGNNLQISNVFFAKFNTLLESLQRQGIGSNTISGINIKPQLGGWV